MRAELVLDARAFLGEGACWDARTDVLWWVDIESERLHRLDPRTGRSEVWPTGQKVGFVQPRACGGLVLGLQGGLAFFDPDTSALEVFAQPEPDRPANRFNDGKCDPAGRLWAGTMAADCAPAAGTLYRVDRDLTVHRASEAVTISNGLAWSHDASTLYYVDTATARIDALTYDLATGKAFDRRPVVTVDERLGSPDGMTIDAEGLLWVAHWDGYAVRRWDPRSGRQVDSIELPTARVTSCAFGGAGLDELYITTAREGLLPAQLEREPHSGSLFVCRPGVRGAAAVPFAG
jgi:sugar lactone lactonase YvrE